MTIAPALERDLHISSLSPCYNSSPSLTLRLTLITSLLAVRN